MTGETDLERRERGHRRTGCAVALGLWVVIGVPLFLFNAMGECLPPGAPNAAACAAERQWIGWFSVFGTPVLFGLIGWLVYRLRRRIR